MILERIYASIESIKVYAENFLTAHKYFKNNNTTIISFETTSRELTSHLDIDTLSDFSSFINVARDTDLNFYDSFIEDSDIFWLNVLSTHGKILRSAMKMAWLTKNISEYGLKNPLQLLQTSSTKYICHPGIGRILVLSQLFPDMKIRCFYVWDKKLDPNPFMITLPHIQINSAFSFLRLFKQNHRFRIDTCMLSSEITDESEYFKHAVTALKSLHSKFELQFITVTDQGHWINDIKGKLFFRDLISFPNPNTCIFGGVKLVQHNNIWKRE
jgi:hypothetical protein